MRKKLKLSAAVILCGIINVVGATDPLPSVEQNEIKQQFPLFVKDLNNLLDSPENLLMVIKDSQFKLTNIFDSFCGLLRCVELSISADHGISVAKSQLTQRLKNPEERKRIIDTLSRILPLCECKDDKWIDGQTVRKIVDFYCWLNQTCLIPFSDLLDVKNWKNIPYISALDCVTTQTLNYFRTPCFDAISLRLIGENRYVPELSLCLFDLIFKSHFFLQPVFDKDGFLIELPLVLLRDAGMRDFECFLRSKWTSCEEEVNKAFMLHIMKCLLPLCRDDQNKINKVLDFYDWFCWTYRVPLLDLWDSCEKEAGEVDKTHCYSDDFRTGKIKLHDLYNASVGLIEKASRNFMGDNCTGYWNIFSVMTQNNRKKYLKHIMKIIEQEGLGTCPIFQQRLRFLRSARELLSDDEFVKLMLWNFHDTCPGYVLPYVPDFIEQTIDALKWGYEHVPLITLLVNLLILPNDILLSLNGVFLGSKKLTLSENIAYAKYEYEFEDEDVIKTLIWDETVEGYVDVTEHSACKWGLHLPVNLDVKGNYLFVGGQVYQVVDGRIYRIEGNLDRREDMSKHDVYEHFTQVLCKPDKKVLRTGIVVTERNLELVSRKFGDFDRRGKDVWSFFNKENLGEYYEQLMSFLCLSPSSCMDICLERLFLKVDAFSCFMKKVIEWGGPIKLNFNKEDDQQSCS